MFSLKFFDLFHNSYSVIGTSISREIYISADNYMFKVNNRNTRARYEICSKLAIKIPE